jgi:hypothetical protein
VPDDELKVTIPKPNPHLYQLVNMGEDSSFWWDSVDDPAGDSQLISSFASHHPHSNSGKTVSFAGCHSRAD